MEQIIIRKAQPDDSTVIALTEKENFSSAWSEKQIADEIIKENSYFFVAEINSEFAGYISADNIIGEVYINNIAVKHIFRNLGVGKALIAELISSAKSDSAVFLTLEVRASNSAARHLYEKCGFINMGERRSFYEKPMENAVIYTLNF